MLIRRLTALLLALCLFAAAAVPAAEASAPLPFSDVKTSDWFYSGVLFAHQQGLMSGTGGNRFSPNLSTSRAMIVTILHKKEGAPTSEGASFADVPSAAWYARAVSWASEEGLVSGYGNRRFGPDDPITREQLAAILYKYFQYKGYQSAASADLNAFTDSALASGYAKVPLGWAVGSQLLSGVGQGRLNPKGPASRAQIAAVLRAFCQQEAAAWAQQPQESPAPTATPLPDTAGTAYQASLEETAALEEAYRQDGYVPEESWPDLLQDLQAWAETNQAEGTVKEYAYSEEDATFSYRTSDGAYVVFIPDLERFEDCAATVMTYEPYRNSTRLKDQNFRKAQEKYGQLDGAAEAFCDIGYSFSVNLDGGAVTMGELEKWKPNSLVFLLTHGAYTEEIGSVLMTTQKYDPKNNPQSAAMNSGSIVVDKHGNIGITEKFIRSRYSKDGLKGCLFWLGACNSARSGNLQRALLDCGAQTVIGTSKSININYLVRLTMAFAQRLNQRNAGGSFTTAGDALDAALKDAANLADKVFGVKLYLAGNRDFRITDNPCAALNISVENDAGGVVGGATVLVDGKEVGKTGNGSLLVEDLYYGRTVEVTVDASPFYLPETQKVTLDGRAKDCKFVLRSAQGKVHVTLTPDRGKITKGKLTSYPVEAGPQGDVTQLVQDGSLKLPKEKESTDFAGSAFLVGQLAVGQWYVLKIEADGYKPVYYRVQAVEEPNPCTINISYKNPSLSVKQTLRIQAVSSLSKEPLGQVDLTLSGRLFDDESYSEMGKLSTNQDGWAEFQYHAGEYTQFLVEAEYSMAVDPYLPVHREFTVENAGDRTQTIELTVGKTGCTTVNLRVTDEAGKAIPGAKLTVYEDPEDDMLIGMILAITTADGKGMCSVAVDDAYYFMRAEAQADGYEKGETAIRTLVMAEGEIFRITLRKTASPTPSPTSNPTPTPAPVPPGTEDYIRIHSYADLKATKGKGNVVLMADISCPDDGQAPFTDWYGILEGNGHSISNLKTMNGHYDERFNGWLLCNKGTIRNVRFQNAQLSTEAPGIGLVAQNYGAIEGCTLDGSLRVYRNVEPRDVGASWGAGFAITNGREGVIKDCVNRASVQVTAYSLGHAFVYLTVGGIAAENYGSVEHCLNLGSLSGRAQGQKPAQSIDIFGIDRECSTASTGLGSTSADCGNGGRLSAEGAALSSNTYPISQNATGGYVTNAMGKRGLTEVSQSELIAKWN